MRKILATAALLLLASGLCASCSSKSPVQAKAKAGPDARAPAKTQSRVTGGVADPAAWVRESYDPAQRAAFDAAPPPAAGADAPAGDGRHSARPEFSPRLRALFADDEKYGGDGIGRLDFNPFSGANDDDIKGAKVAAEEVDGAPDRKVVTAKFRNMDADQTIVFFWERIGGLWYIDDIAGRTAGEPNGWTLSLILKYGQGSI